MQSKLAILVFAAFISSACSTRNTFGLEEKVALPSPNKLVEPYILGSIMPGNPDDRFSYKYSRAKDIAVRLLPSWADKVVRAELREALGFPGGMHMGLSVYFTLAPKVVNGSLCETTIIYMSYRPDAPPQYNAPVEVKIIDGKIAGYSPESMQALKRNIRLSNSPSEKESVAQCEASIASALQWQQGSAEDALRNEQQIAWLMKELSADRRRIKCIDKDNKECKISLQTVIETVRANPPQERQSIMLPGREAWTVFKFIRSGEKLATGYSIAISERSNQAGEIRFQFVERPILEVIS